MKVGKNGGLLVKASEKKSRVFLVHGVLPKVECPPAIKLCLAAAD